MARNKPTVQPSSRPTVYLGVDAGGSHTEAVVLDQSGSELARARGAAGAVNPENIPQAARAIIRTVKDALKRAGTKDAQALVVGAAGAGREKVRLELERALKKSKVTRRTRVTTDGEIALAHAFPDSAGILLIAGTGSIAYGRGGETQPGVRRAGGLGWQMGDEGGGYAMGRMALAVAGRALDGRGMRTAVTQELLKATETEGVDGLIAWAQTADRTAVAALVPAVLEAAAQGDTVARQLIDTTSADLAMLAAGLLRQFGSPAPDRVALSGSLLSPGSPVRTGLAAALSRVAPHLKILDTPIDPALGAARLATRL